MGKVYSVRSSDVTKHDPAQAGYSDVWLGFWGFSSTHGFPFVLSSKGKRKLATCSLILFYMLFIKCIIYEYILIELTTHIRQSLHDNSVFIRIYLFILFCRY